MGGGSTPPTLIYPQFTSLVPRLSMGGYPGGGGEALFPGLDLDSGLDWTLDWTQIMAQF